MRFIGLVALALPTSLVIIAHGQASEHGQTKLHVGGFETSKRWFSYGATQHLGIENLTDLPIASVVIECAFYGGPGYSDGSASIFGPIAARQTLWIKITGSDINPIDRAKCEIPEGGVR